MSPRSSVEARREKRMSRSSSLPLTHQPAGREARNRTGDIPVARRNAQAKALGLLKPTEILTSDASAPVVDQQLHRLDQADQLREVVRSDAKSNLMDFHPEQVNGHWYIQYPLAVFGREVEKTP